MRAFCLLFETSPPRIQCDRSNASHHAAESRLIAPTLFGCELPVRMDIMMKKIERPKARRSMDGRRMTKARSMDGSECRPWKTVSEDCEARATGPQRKAQRRPRKAARPAGECSGKSVQCSEDWILQRFAGSSRDGRSVERGLKWLAVLQLKGS